MKNANVDVNTFMLFQETENGGFQKRISMDGASVLLTFLVVIYKNFRLY